MPAAALTRPVDQSLLPQRRRHLFALLVALLLAVASPLGSGWGASAGTAESVVSENLYADVLPAFRDEVMAATADAITTYEIEVTLDPATNTLAGSERVRFANQTPDPLNEVYFRLFPNATYYGAGDLAINAVRVAGRTVAPELSVGDTVLRVPLAEPLPPGERVEIDLDFVTTVPTNSAGSYGIFNRDTASGTWVLADWYPIVAGYEPDAGWRLDPPTSFGDPTFAESALYDVTVAAPPGLQVVASGTAVETATTAAGSRQRYVAGPARDFTLVADDDYVATSATVGGTTVTSYAEPEAATAGQAALAAAASALTAFGQRFGPYPFAELDLVQTPLGGASGVSWAGILFLDGPRLYGTTAAADPAAFESVVAHEVGHQWWGGSVGANTNDHTFMVEGLTNYLTLDYMAGARGEAVGDRLFQAQVVGPYRALLELSGDAVVDVPIAEGQDKRVRATVFYGKAALGFLAIRNAVGDEAFFAALRDYADRFAFRIATPADLRSAFEAASGQDLSEIWRFWFEAAETTSAEVDEVINGV